MGYNTNYQGTITISKTKLNDIKLLLKYLYKLGSKCEWISSSGSGGRKEWFYPCDEWIGYLPKFKWDNNKLIIDSDNKHYNNSVEHLLYMISHIDKKAKGKVTWRGEDESDNGLIITKNGGINVNEEIITKFDDTKIRFKINEHIIYINKKYDFISLIKNYKLDLKGIEKTLFIESV